MTTTMCVIVPTRGRPDNAWRLIQAVNATADSNTTSELIFAVDDDDPELERYIEVVPAWAQLEVGPRLRLGPTLSHHAVLAAQRYDIVGFMGDDHVPRTPSWDLDIVEAMQPGGIVYGNDLIQGPNLPTAVFMDAAIINLLGYMVPPGFTHLFIDNLWKTWGERLGSLTYLPNTIIEHAHPVAGKAEWDERYAEVNSGEVWEKDQRAYDEYVRDTLASDIATLKRGLST